MTQIKVEAGAGSETADVRMRGPPSVPDLPPQALLSHRTQEVTISLRATGLVLKALPDSDTEGEDREKQSRVRVKRQEGGG